MTSITLGAQGLPQFTPLPHASLDRLKLLLQVSRACGDIGTFHLGKQAFVLINSAAYARTILVDQPDAFEKSRYQRHLGSAGLGNGLLSSPNATHRRQRRLLAPAFDAQHLTAYTSVMADYAEQLQQTWADGAIIDLTHEMMQLTLRIIGKTMFALDLETEAAALGEAMTLAIRAADQAFNGQPRWPANSGLDDEHVRAALTYLGATVTRMFTSAPQAPEQQGRLLKLLLAAYDPQASASEPGSEVRLTESQVRDEIMTMLIAGHENPRNALTWTWYLLAQHAEVYERLQAELAQVLAGRSPTAADLPRLPYTLQVYKEALRLYPPAYAFGRQAVQPVRVGKYTLPAGTEIVISPYTLHRRPDYFPDPECFDPDRFSPANEQRLLRHAYLPFGSGPRGCIGAQFALFEGQFILATLAQRVTFELLPGQQIEPEPLVTLRPRGRVKVAVRRR